MKLRLSGLLLAAACCAPCLLPSPAKAEPSPGIAGIDKAKLKGMPWHLADMWWDIGEAATKEEFQSLDLDFTIKGKVPSGVNLYIAPTGGAGGLDCQHFYGGLQTDSQMNRTWAEPQVHQRRAIGRAAIFSVWGDRSLDSIVTPADGHFDSSGHEGDFISVRHRVQWGEGRYTFRVQRLLDGDDQGKPRTWVGAFVIDHQTREVTWVGAVRLKEAKALHLTRRLSAFVEIYGSDNRLEALPFGLEVTFYAPKVNGKTVEKPRAMEQFDPGIPDLMTASAVNAAGEELADPKAGNPMGMRFKLGTQPVVREKRHRWVF